MKMQLKRYLGSLVFVFLLCLSIALGSTAGVLFVYNSDLPQVSSLEDYRPSLITEVFGDDGQIIGSFALERRIVVTWDQIPQVVKDAIISVEDQNFYEHWGIDFYGIARAGLKNLMAGRVVEGGSTLTQQLSKNLFLTPERSFRRKIQEAMLSIQIERYYTKPQIFTLYCNLHFMGHGQYGFAAAAEYYFNKDLKDLNIEEAALLAALRRAMHEYDKRHGWRGAERNGPNEGLTDLYAVELPDWKLPIRTNDIVPGVILDLTPTGAIVKIANYQAQLTPQDIAWTRAKSASDILNRGDVALFMIRTMSSADRKVEVTLEQKPVVL